MFRIIIYLFNMFYFFGYRIKKLRILNLSTSFTEKIFRFIFDRIN